MSNTPQPSVGRIVHYVSHGTPPRADGSQAFTSECRAAIITEVGAPEQFGADDDVSLCVLNPTGLFFNRGVPYDEGDTDSIDDDPGAPVYPGGTWHWPERV
jgi:hypothetical protein